MFQQKTLYAAFLLINCIFHSPSQAWDGTPPQGEARELNLEFSLDGQPNANVWQSGRIGVDDDTAIALEIVTDFTNLAGAYIFIFDRLGTLVERVSIDKIDSASVWTGYVEGGQILLEVVGKNPLPAQVIKIPQLRVPRAGRSDQVVDGIADFRSPEAESLSGVTDVMRKSVARLIVGQNEYPLNRKTPTKTPDWCSGFLVAPKLLMTASHCLKLVSESCKQAIALFGYSLDQAEPVSAHRCVRVIYHNRYIDTAILELDSAPTDASIASLAFRAVTTNEVLRVIQHPHGSVRLASADGACTVGVASIRSWPSHEDLDYSLLEGIGFSHRCDTVNGSSGSPIFALDGSVVGIHQGGDDVVNTGLKMSAILSCLSIDKNNNSVILKQQDRAICRNSLD